MPQNLNDPVVAPVETKQAPRGLRRTRLREFQAQLVERMQAAQRGDFTQVNQLGILVGPLRYLLDLRESGEIVSTGSLMAVPLTKDWYVGLSNIRGNLTSVVDWPRFQGHDVTNRDARSRIVAFAPALAFNSGLLVSQVLGLRNIADMEEVVFDQHGNDQRAWLSRKFRDRDGNFWYALSLSVLLQDQDFLHIGL